MEIHLGGDAADADEGSSIPTIAEMQAVVERQCGAAYMGCMGYALSLIGTIAANPTSCSWCEEVAALQKGTGGRISYALVIIATRRTLNLFVPGPFAIAACDRVRRSLGGHRA